MASRRRTLLFSCALAFGAVLVPASLAAARPVQDPGATFGGAGAETTTRVPGSAVSTTVEGGSKTNQTLVESEDTPDQPVFTENRKVAAIIAGLIIVALALLLLTVRYIRVTKPRSSDDIDPSIPMLPLDVEIDEDSVFIDEPASPVSEPDEPGPPPAAAEPATTIPAATSGAESGTDHDAADDDWKPRTGEQERVEIPTGATLARPGVVARRKALGIEPD